MTTLDKTLGLWCLQSETTNNSTVFVDSVSNDNVEYNNAYHSTNQKKFGNSSIFINTDAYIELPILQNNQALDFWIYLDSNNKNILSTDNIDNYIKIDTENNIIMQWYNITGDIPIINTYSYDTLITDNNDFILNEWNHIYIYYQYSITTSPPLSLTHKGIYYSNAIIRSINTTIKLAVNGILYSKNNLRQFINTYSFGLLSSNLRFSNIDGYLEEIRISNSIITTDFDLFNTPYPIAPILLSQYYIQGMIQKDINGVLNNMESCTIRAYNRNTGILLGQDDLNNELFFEIIVPNEELIYVICLDNNLQYNAIAQDRIIPQLRYISEE